MELARTHLDTVARRMGHFLRGFGDGTRHTGSLEGFVREFSRLFDVPVVRLPGEPGAVTYAHALGRAVAEGLDRAATDPVSVLAAGLSGPLTTAQGLRCAVPAATLREDLATLLGRPALHYYLAVTDYDRVAAALGPDTASPAAFVRLPIGSAVRAVLSFDALCAVAALDDVVSYQEDTRIVALDGEAAERGSV